MFVPHIPPRLPPNTTNTKNKKYKYYSMFVPQTPPRLPYPLLPNVMVALSILTFYVKRKVLCYFF